MKKTKRALELEEAEARVNRLKKELAEETRRSSTYLQRELQQHLRRLFSSISDVTCDSSGGIRVVFDICRLAILNVASQNGWMRETTQFSIGNLPCVLIHEETCEFLHMSNATKKHVELFARFLPDAVAIAQDIVPKWRKQPPNVEFLMTTRVLRWISKQVGGQWPDVVAGHVVDKIQ